MRIRIATESMWPVLLVGSLVALFPIANALGWMGLAVGAAGVGMVAGMQRRAAFVLALAFVLRAGLAVVQFYLFALPDSTADAVAFESRAWGLVQARPDDFFAGFDSGWRLYVWLLSAAYRVADRSPLLLQSANVFFGTLIVLHVFLIADALWGRRAGRHAGLLAAVFPTLMLYSAITMREVAVVYTATLGAWFLVRWRQTARFRWLAPMLGAFFLSATFHSASLAFMIVVGMLLLTDAFGATSAKWWLRGPRGVIGLAALGIFVVLMSVSGWGLDKVASLMAQGFSTELILDLQQGRATGRAAYLAWLPLDHPIDLVWQTPLRVVYLLYTPFPWMVTSPGDLIAFLDASLYMWLTWRIFRFRREISRSSAGLSLLLISGALVAVLALGTSNYGTAMRHRAKAAPLLIALGVGAGIGDRREKAARAALGVADPATHGVAAGGRA